MFLFTQRKLAILFIVKHVVTQYTPKILLLPRVIIQVINILPKVPEPYTLYRVLELAMVKRIKENESILIIHSNIPILDRILLVLLPYLLQTNLVQKHIR